MIKNASERALISCLLAVAGNLLLTAVCRVRVKLGLFLVAGCMLQVCLDLSGQDCTITPVQTDILCYGENTGTINISVSGGTEPYVFAWTGPGSFGSISQNLTGLGAGSYTVTVIGAGSSCTGTATVIISQPLQPLTITTQPLNQNRLLRKYSGNFSRSYRNCR